MAAGFVLPARAQSSGSAPAREVPPPAAVIGFVPGTDSLLADWGQITRYYGALAQASPYVRVDTLGPTTLGRPFLLVTLASPALHARLEQVRRGQRRLADPRSLRPGEADSLRAVQPAVVLIGNNIHSTEIGSSLMGMVLAHRLATEARLTRLLDSVVVLLVPSLNPDGLDTTVAWYRRYRGTRYEGGPLPWLYHRYVGHDNNRDWYMMTQAETRLVSRVLYREWFPEIVYDVHQMGGRGERLFLPPFSDPVNPNLDPALVAATNAAGTAMASALYDAGLVGVAHQRRFDLWWHGGFRTVPARHNMIGILSEAASARLASPDSLHADSLRQPDAGVNAPAPWPGGRWTIGDIVRYELVAAEALVRHAAATREQLISRFVEMGRRAVERGLAGDPFAWVLPPAPDAGARATIANALLMAGVEVFRAAAPFEAEGRRWPAGTLVVPLAQPFRAHVQDLFEPQAYPHDREPYDIAGWTLPLTMDVPATAVRAPFTADLARIDSVRVEPGRVTGTGDVFLLANRANAESRAVAALLAAGQSVGWTDTAVVVWGPRTRAILVEHAARYGFDVRAVRAAPPGTRAVRRSAPRIALYQPYTASMDEGWTRWTFEQYGISFTTVHDSDVRAGDLRRRFDVIVLPSESSTRIADGRDSLTLPPEYSRGLAPAGEAALTAFVRSGGTLVCLNASSDFAISRLNIPVRNVLATDAQTQQGSRFSAPGSILGVAFGPPGGGARPSAPLLVGVPDSLGVFFEGGGAFELDAPARALGWYAARPLRSGFARNGERISGKAAVVEVAVGGGRVILFGFRPQFRGQTHGAFRLLFNAVLLAAP
jgi:hypothetical protein